MKVKQTCAANIFANMHTIKVTSTNEIITNSSTVETDACGNARGVTLSDTVLIPKVSTISAWVWDSRYLISINGLTYPVRTVHNTPYIKGLSFKPDFMKHINTSLLYIPFMDSIVSLAQSLIDPHPEQLTHITLATALPVSRTLVFLAGRLLDHSALASDGSHLVITPPPGLLAHITAPPDGIVYPPIVTLNQLLNHPGTFMVALNTDVAISHTPVGKSIDGIIYGAPPEHQSLGLGSNGEILPYQYISSYQVRARYCTPVISTWTTISSI